MAAKLDPMGQAFETAMQDFKTKLNDDPLFSEILATTTIDQVYDATDKLQQEQAKQGHLRHLAKIQPYLEGLNNYAGVIEVFLQVKPDIMALIWGPIKLIILWASVLKQSFDAIINITAEIGQLLPEFREVAKLFGHNSQIKEIMLLFFKDILDFYIVALRFFKKPRWKYFFESLWPSHRSKIKLVGEHINRLALLLRNEVRMEHIQEEHAARARALEHFDRAEKHHRQQEYQAMKADICPRTYDDRHDHFQSQICPGTGRWLLKELAFTNCLNMSDTSANLLWLQGIPGAGKTYLSSTAINRTRSFGTSIFAYISYTQSNTTTALSIIHSMIFQLAADDDDLQEVLCQSSSKIIKRSLEDVTLVLTTLLKCAEHVYIIVDGVDEIDELERGKLVDQLLSLSKSCPGTKILISSRMEEDLAKLLDGKATKIRVDHCNAGSIQAFVSQQQRSWYQEREFPPEERAEIDGLLAPLSANSKGMFLYARIVLGNIRDLDINEIRRELQVLPEDLDDAYARILARVNKLRPPTLKEKARRLLGWIACAPNPLTLPELEQALMIRPGDTEGSARWQSNLNVSRICGPIIENINGYVQLVHFTAKRYLFSDQIPGFIDSTNATLSLAISCLTYLCGTHYDPAISNEDFDQNLLNGAFRFHDFAAHSWFVLVERCRLSRQNSPCRDELIRPLQELMIKRYNDTWSGSQSQCGQSNTSFESQGSDIHNFLDRAAMFFRACKNSDFSMHRNNDWKDLDPLTISNISIRIYQKINNIQCKDQHHDEHCLCYSPVPRMHYGTRQFRCGFISCSFRRHGFESRLNRDSHMRHHARPWKCSFPGCEFADGGFLSRKMRDEHLDQAHKSKSYIKDIPIGTLDQDEIQPLIFDVIRSGNLEVLSAMAKQFHTLPLNVRWEACKLAACAGSVSLLKMLSIRHVFDAANWLESRKWMKEITLSLVQSGSSQTLGYTLSELMRGPSYQDGKFPLTCENAVMHPSLALPGVLESDSIPFYQEFERVVSTEEIVKQTKKVRKDVSLWTFEYLRPDVIKATAGKSNREEYLLLLWNKLDLPRTCGPHHLGRALCNVASTTCSVNLATFLLDCGANINHQSQYTQRTPLHQAATKDSAAAADFMRLLLVRGANYHVDLVSKHMNHDSRKKDSKKINIRDEIGVKNISQWLKVSWDDLIATIEDEKKNKDCDSKLVNVNASLGM